MECINSDIPNSYTPDGFLTVEQVKQRVGEFKGAREKILHLLGDGRPHTKDSLIACLGDPLASQDSMRMHLTWLRKLLRPLGEDVVCFRGRRKANETKPADCLYQLVRLPSPIPSE